MAPTGSKLVVYAALAGNLAIAVTKLAAASYTGSGAMFTEAVHSFVDTGNQGLLLYGMRRAARPADDSHNFGHGLELYFWSFVVALLIFTLGGAYAVYEGVEKLRHPEPVTAPWVNVGVIALSGIFEGLSFRTARREMRARFARESLWTAVTRSKDPSTFAIILEDGAALIGLGFALAGIVASGFLGWSRGDGVASVAIGCLLIATAGVLFRETRSLLTGESASPRVIEQAKGILTADPRVVRIERMRSLQLGPGTVLLAVTLDLAPHLSGAELRRATADLRAAIRHGLPGVAHLYVQLPVREHEGQEAARRTG
ncbi:cation diffusion facilitator family transporter [Methylobacterium currus]|uniref:cation diffusion facilitator family transporter n=1 Tax=Methylobacterium currus TaxID=2051553 RepID=UPI001E3AE57E|nr:cation diffusion facilitator family transporter [Methylobacterium currus]UHC16608.1 cation diffusion facilitator family transporter [Methylobacterium currus]